MRRLAVLLCAVALAIAGCARSPETPVREAVLQPGEVIEASNKFGTVRVAYVSPREREFTWDGQSRTIKMIARPEPFLDELGLYEPAACFPIFCRFPRLVVREARHDFPNYEALYKFVYAGSAVMDWAYTSDGLLVGFGRTPEREQINVDVRQLTVRGQKPFDLRGARDGNVRLHRNGARS